jgi:hypothetical protein
LVKHEFILTVINEEVHIFTGAVCPKNRVVFQSNLKEQVTVTFPFATPFDTSSIVLENKPVEKIVTEDSFGDYVYEAVTASGKNLPRGLLAVGNCVSEDRAPVNIIYESDATLTVGLTVVEDDQILFNSNPLGSFLVDFESNPKFAPLYNEQGLRLPNPFQVIGSKLTLVGKVKNKKFTFKVSSLNASSPQGSTSGMGNLQTGGAQQADIIIIPR